jgi:RND family efflux transporter MFP subunit
MMSMWKNLVVAALALLAAPALGAEAVPVTVQPLQQVVIYPEQRAPATVLSLNDSRLSAELNARVIDIPVQVGQEVAAGTPLVRLEKADFELALQRQQAAAASLAARLDLARYQWERTKSLSQQQAVSDELLKQREADVKSLEAEQQGQQAALAQARRQLDKTEIRAPFRAIVTERLTQVGELAAPGTPLVRIVDAARLEVSAQVQAEQAANLAAAAAPLLVSDGRRYALQLRAITPVVDSRSRTREARLSFGATAALPGTAGELVWQSPQAHIPAELLVKRQGRLGIFRAEDGHARFTALAGAQVGRPAAVPAGMNSVIIVEGRYRLQDGDAIVIGDQATEQEEQAGSSR